MCTECISLYPPPCLCARSWRVVASCRVLLPETLYRNYWRSGRATAQNKSLKVTILRGYRNPEIENSHPSAAKSLLLLKMCVWCCPGSRSPVVACTPPGDPKNHRNSMFFRKLFEWSLGGRRGTKVSSRTPQGTEKGSRMVTFWALWDHFWPQNCNIGTLLEHCYLLHF